MKRDMSGTEAQLVDAFFEGQTFEVDWKNTCVLVKNNVISIDGMKYLCYEIRDGKPCIGVNLSLNTIETAEARFDIINLFLTPDMVRHVGEEVRKVAMEPEGLGMTVMYIPLGKSLMADQQTFTIDDLWEEL